MIKRAHAAPAASQRAGLTPEGLASATTLIRGLATALGDPADTRTQRQGDKEAENNKAEGKAMKNEAATAV